MNAPTYDPGPESLVPALTDSAKMRGGHNLTLWFSVGFDWTVV